MLQNFINAWSGKYIPSRGGITGQCVSMVQRWAEDHGVGGTPVFPVPAAKDMPGIRGDAFDWIPNTPTGVPQPGDIIVWNTAVGPYGHTAIFVDGNASSFRSFDQNWPTGSAAHIQNHNYNGVVGWLRFKAQAPQGGQPMLTEQQARDFYKIVLGRDPENASVLQGRGAIDFVYGAKAEADAYRAGMQAQIKQLNDRVNELQKVLTEAQKVVETQANTLKEAGDLNTKLDKKVSELNAKIEALSSSTPTTLSSYTIGELISAVIKKIFNKEV